MCDERDGVRRNVQYVGSRYSECAKVECLCAKDTMFVCERYNVCVRKV